MRERIADFVVAPSVHGVAGLKFVAVNPNKTEDLQVGILIETLFRTKPTVTLQVIRYREKEIYSTHEDYIDTSHEPRVATFILYLSDVVGGGDTIFSDLEVDESGEHLIPADKTAKAC